MKITGWTRWDDPRYERMYPKTNKEYEGVLEIITHELRTRGYKFTGDYHQNGDFGVPVFDNKMVYQCSQRCWGELMVMAYPDEIDNSDDMGYCLWAWDEPEDMKVPSHNDYHKNHKEGR